MGVIGSINAGYSPGIGIKSTAKPVMRWLIAQIHVAASSVQRAWHSFYIFGQATVLRSPIRACLIFIVVIQSFDRWNTIDETQKHVYAFLSWGMRCFVLSPRHFCKDVAKMRAISQHLTSLGLCTLGNCNFKVELFICFALWLLYKMQIMFYRIFLNIWTTQQFLC